MIIPKECYEEYGQDLDGCSTQENEGCGRCKLVISENVEVSSRYLKSTLESFIEIAKRYGVDVETVEKGQGGIFINGKKLTSEEWKEYIHAMFPYREELK